VLQHQYPQQNAYCPVDGVDLRLAQAANGDNRTAFSLFEIEFQMLKPFLMYDAVFAGNMAASNVCYLEDWLSSYMQNANEQIAGSAPTASCSSPRKRKLRFTIQKRLGLHQQRPASLVRQVRIQKP
jgi:hypothetical protein